MNVEIRMLGEFRVLVDGISVDLGHPRQRCVTAVMLIHPNEPFTVDQLADRVWGSRPTASLRNNLYGYLSRLRRTVHSFGLRVEKRTSGYALRVEPLVIDIHRFRHLVSQARAQRDDLAAIRLFDMAIDLWHGEPFLGLDSVWLATVREILEQEYLTARLDRNDVALRIGRHHELMATVAELTAAHPLDERAAQQLMLTLHRSGRRAEALAEFDRVRRTLVRELGIEPNAHLRELQQRILTADLSPETDAHCQPERIAAASQGDSWPAHRLPVKLTPFIGRTKQLREIRGRLRDHRLVTLTGPGGCGKTRLALRVAEEWTEGRRLFVDLAPLTLDAAVDSALAISIGAPEAPGERPVDAVARHIGDAPVLLVLDNCDRLIAGCAQVVDLLLRECGRLTVLTTSREPLRVEGELVKGIPPMSLPSSDDALDGDAVALFLSRADLDPDQASYHNAAVRRICERLDGMPLAIELAAARAATLPIPEILSGLAERFLLLRGGPRPADPRLQSLAESIHWSYDLLPPVESRVLQRLSVFRAAFTMDGARAVAAYDGVAGKDVHTIVCSLVEKSFVVASNDDDEPRYRLLESIREFSAMKLAASNDLGTARTNHLRHVRDLAEQTERQLETTSARSRVAEFGSKLADVKAAVCWAKESGEADDALRLVGALSLFWYTCGTSEGSEIIQDALSISCMPCPSRARALISAAWAAVARFDPDAIRLAQEAVQVATTCDDTRVAARTHATLGWAVSFFDFFDPNEARTNFQVACKLAVETGDRWCAANAMTGLAGTELHSLPDARLRAEEALAQSADAQMNGCWAGILTALVALMQGRLDDARNTALAALETVDMLRDALDKTSCLAILGWTGLLQGNKDTASYVEACRITAEATGNPLALGFAHLVSGLRHYAGNDLPESYTALNQAKPFIAAVLGGVLDPFVSANLAEVALLRGDTRAARNHAKRALLGADQIRNKWAQSRASLAYGKIFAHADQISEAAEAAERTLTMAQNNDDSITTVDAMELLAEIERSRERHTRGLELADEANRTRLRIGYRAFS